MLVDRGQRKGKHAYTLDEQHFTQYIEQLHDIEADIMLEIKDKETSALNALSIAQGVFSTT
jgi:UV DNA damage endonuclease